MRTALLPDSEAISTLTSNTRPSTSPLPRLEPTPEHYLTRGEAEPYRAMSARSCLLRFSAFSRIPKSSWMLATLLMPPAASASEPSNSEQIESGL